MTKSTDCVFCEIARTGFAEEFQTWGSLVVSFRPLNPVTPGHLLFVPRHHSENASESSHSSVAFATAAMHAAAMDLPFNIITSGGEEATQTVFHTHIHYVPRRKDDGLLLPWSNQ